MPWRIRASAMPASLPAGGPITRRHRTLRRFAQHQLAVVGTVFLIVIVLLAAAAPVVSFNDPYRVDLRARGKPPSADHVLGTELAGRDEGSGLGYCGQGSPRGGG